MLSFRLKVPIRICCLLLDLLSLLLLSVLFAVFHALSSKEIFLLFWLPLQKLLVLQKMIHILYIHLSHNHRLPQQSTISPNLLLLVKKSNPLLQSKGCILFHQVLHPLQQSILCKEKEYNRVILPEHLLHSCLYRQIFYYPLPI